MIRLMQPADAPWVADLIRTAFAAIEPALDPAPSALRVTKDDILCHLHLDGGAVHGREGCILWCVKNGGLYLGRLAVLPEHRGQGIATGLLAHAERVARDLGLARMCLEVRLALEGNRRLFARAGFIEGARRSHAGYPLPTYVEADKILGCGN